MVWKFHFQNWNDWCHGDGAHLMRTGDRTIELTFDQALRETVSAMAYCEYDDLLRIDEARTVEITSKSWIPKSFSTYYFRINSLLLHPSVVPIDHFDPITEKKPSVCIINTDLCDEPGSHWVAVFIKSNSETEPFHSYELLSLNEELGAKLKFFSHVEFYTTKLQGFSTVCEEYCLVHLSLRSRRFFLQKIVKLLSIVTVTVERHHVIGVVMNLTYHEPLREKYQVVDVTF